MGERRRIPGTKEILFTGIPSSVVEEIKSACKGRTATGRDWTYGELFLTEIYPLWKKAETARIDFNKFLSNPNLMKAIREAEKRMGATAQSSQGHEGSGDGGAEIEGPFSPKKPSKPGPRKSKDVHKKSANQ